MRYSEFVRLAVLELLHLHPPQAALDEAELVAELLKQKGYLEGSRPHE